MPITRKRTPKGDRLKKRQIVEKVSATSDDDEPPSPLPSPKVATTKKQPPKRARESAKEPPSKRSKKASPKTTKKMSPKAAKKASPKTTKKASSKKRATKAKPKALNTKKAPIPMEIDEGADHIDEEDSKVDEVVTKPAPSEIPDNESDDKGEVDDDDDARPSATTATPAAKFHFRQRVYAKDTETAPGMLFYQGVVRRAMYGVQHQRQIRLSATMSPEQVAAALEGEPEPTWWYFIHYGGWNVKWDRWVEERHLYEATEATKAFCERLHKEVKEIRKANTKNKQQAGVAVELERRMVQIETEHRLAERKRALASATTTDAARLLAEEEEATTKVAATTSKSATKKRPKSNKTTDKWAKKANLQKEMGLRRDHELQGRRSQATSELLVLPFALKKILVEEWEIMAQCKGMLAILPAAVPIRQALTQYLDQKLENLNSKKGTKKEEDKKNGTDDKITKNLNSSSNENDETDTKEKAVPVKPTESTPSSRDIAQNRTDDGKNNRPKAEMSAQEREWREMVDGVCLFFDQALPERLLYQSEKIQHQILVEEMTDKSEGNKTKTNSDIYGCEFLLRMFLRLPALLVGELSERESKSILAKLNDLVRFLQKHQTTLFAQSYRRWNDVELSRQQEDEQ